MNKTKIDWADMTWNPVTGCLHNCKYCYAERIANRFGGQLLNGNGDMIHDLERPQLRSVDSGFDSMGYPVVKDHIIPYPFGFEPTFHRYRLDEPMRKTKPSKIFVCSMADLFGEWVPDEWIDEVFKACEAAPQHQYLFLTKNAKRYTEIINSGLIKPLSNYWFGTTVTNKNGDAHKRGQGINTFVSIEPLLEDLGKGNTDEFPDWIIVGAQTGPGAVPPKPEWVQSIIDQCRSASIPIFLKDNLKWPEKIQEFPEGLK